MAIMDTVLTDVYERLGGLSIKIEDVADLQPSFKDTLRELGIAIASADSTISADSPIYLYVVIRTEYWAIHRIRNGQTLNFKYSTGADGRSVDKTSIMRNLTAVMSEINMAFLEWRDDVYAQNIKVGTQSSGRMVTFARRTYSPLGGDS